MKQTNSNDMCKNDPPKSILLNFYSTSDQNDLFNCKLFISVYVNYLIDLL